MSKQSEQILEEQLIVQLQKLGYKYTPITNEKELLIKRLRKEMLDAAQKFDFETAALIRDRIKTLRAN